MTDTPENVTPQKISEVTNRELAEATYREVRELRNSVARFESMLEQLATNPTIAAMVNGGNPMTAMLRRG